MLVSRQFARAVGFREFQDRRNWVDLTSPFKHLFLYCLLSRENSWRRSGLALSPYWVICKHYKLIYYTDSFCAPNSDDIRDGTEFGRLLLLELCLKCFSSLGPMLRAYSQFTSTHVYSRLQVCAGFTCPGWYCRMQRVPQKEHPWKPCHSLCRGDQESRHCWDLQLCTVPTTGLEQYCPCEAACSSPTLRRCPEFQSSKYRLWFTHQA